MVYLIMACMAATFATIFWCGIHPSINWRVPLCLLFNALCDQEANSRSYVRLHPQTCSSFTSGHLQKVTWTLNIIGELLCKSRNNHLVARIKDIDRQCAPVFTFPFSILKSLHFTGMREKFGLGLVFSFGFITIVVTTGRFIVMLIDVNDISLCKSQWSFSSNPDGNSAHVLMRTPFSSCLDHRRDIHLCDGSRCYGVGTTPPESRTCHHRQPQEAQNSFKMEAQGCQRGAATPGPAKD